jgi:hypothetical protein
LVGGYGGEPIKHIGEVCHAGRDYRGVEGSAADHGDLTPRNAVRRLIEHLPVTDIRVEEPDLEDVVRQAFRR